MLLRIVAVAAVLIGFVSIHHAQAVVCKRVGVPKGCVPIRGAPGADVLPGAGALGTAAAGPRLGPTRGGPVNRVGALWTGRPRGLAGLATDVM